MIERGISPRSLIQATPNSTMRYPALIRIIWVRLKLIGISLALQDEGDDDQDQPEQVGRYQAPVGSIHQSMMAGENR